MTAATLVSPALIFPWNSLPWNICLMTPAYYLLCFWSPNLDWKLKVEGRFPQGHPLHWTGWAQCPGPRCFRGSWICQLVLESEGNKSELLGWKLFSYSYSPTSTHPQNAVMKYNFNRYFDSGTDSPRLFCFVRGWCRVPRTWPCS